VAVDRQLGLPDLDDLRLQEAHLGRLLPHVVAVEVDARARRPRADQGRTELALEPGEVELAVRRIDSVVAVGVEQRDDDERELGEHVIVAAVEQIAHQHQARLFALDLAGVDAVDDQHDRQPAPPRRIGRADIVRRQHAQRQVTATGAGAEGRQVKPLVPARRQPRQKLHHVRVERGFLVGRSFRTRL
jgi:hypothetical protein